MGGPCRLWYIARIFFEGGLRPMGRCQAGSAGFSAMVGGRLAVALLLLVALATAVVPAAAHAADPNKVLRVVFNAAETGFDPVRVSDNYSNIVNGAIFET